ncbi:hypothetical protein F5Y15DRAFT_414555 [Xylariaceae sp. FL0016]|nr:hypothetical protein F5Y15DRAFT_414555 [Xylariaceae sp. FL0016]
MQFSLATLLVGLVAVSSASVVPDSNAVLAIRQNAGRPVPSGECCVANTSLKQDTCTSSSGAAGRCVPGGNDCGGTLSCVATADLACDNSIQERGKSLCRAVAGNGFIDGANIISSLDQATIN